MPEAIRIGEPAIEVRLRRNARARRMVLRVASAGRAATLTLPPGVSLSRARAFVADHEAWLRRHLSAAPARMTMVEGSVLPFGDGTLTLRHRGGRSTGRSGDTLLVGGPAAELGPRAAVWLREQARVACLAGVERHARTLGRRVGRISLRDPRSRWGSCTATGDLMFSWRLVMAPTAVLDYVVAHEVAHLAELNHSAAFWAVVRGLCPGLEASREWLRRHGQGLHRLDFVSGAA